MPEPLEAELELSLTSALNSLDDLGNATVEALTKAGDEGATAIESAISAIPPMSIDADFSDAQTQLDLFNADATTPVVLPVESDTGDAVNQLDLFSHYVEDQHPTVVIDADTSDAVDAVSELEDQVSAIGDSADSASGGVSGLDAATKGLGATTGLATGSAAGLGSAIGGLGEHAGVAVGGFLAVTGAVTAFFHEGLSATGSIQRFAFTLGDMADRVEQLKDLDGLNTTLGDLALKLGSDDDALRQVVSTQYRLATGSGVADAAASKYVETLAALAARAVALNPQLGDVNSVAQSLGTALSRGGRFASRFGLDLSTAQISSRALADTGKETASQLTFVEKSMAGAALAAEKYGAHIQKDITDGSKNAIIQQKVLTQQISEQIEAAGKPLVMPILDLLKAGIPIFEAAGKAISEIAIVAIPLVTSAAEGFNAEVDGMIEATSAVVGVVSDFVDLLNQAGGLGDVVAISVGVMAAAIVAFNAVVGTSFELTTGWVGVLAGIGALAAKPAGNALADLAVDFGIADRRGVDFGAMLNQIMGQAAAFSKLGTNDTIPMLNKMATELHRISTLSDGVVGSRAVEKLDAFRKIAEANVGAAANLITQLEHEGHVTTAYQHILDMVVASKKNDAAASAANTVATTKLTGSYEDQIKVLDNLQNALLAQYDKQFAATHAQESADDAVANLNSSYKDAIDSGKSVAEATGLWERALTSADEQILHASAAIAANTEEQHKGEGAVKAHNAAVDEQIAYLEHERDVVGADSPLGKKIQEHIDQLKDIPKAVETDVTVTGAGSAVITITELNRQLAILATTDIDVALLTAEAALFPKAAEGAVIQPRPGGTMVNVGEAGATEVIVPTDDPAQAMRLLRQGGLGGLLAAPARPMAPSRGAGGAYATQSSVDRSITAPITVLVARDGEQAASKTVRRLRTLQLVGSLDVEGP